MRWPFLLPAAALILVAAGISAALFVSNGNVSSARDQSAIRTNSAEPARAVAARPAGDVCQGLLQRPESSGPRVFSSHYTQQAEAKGITIVASEGVDAKALAVAQETIEAMFANNELAKPLADDGAYVIIADGLEGILDLPEFGCLEDDAVANRVSHACGIADRADYPVATVNERDLLGEKRGPCGGLNILYHELGHLVQGWSLDAQDYFDVKYYYQSALDAGKYRNFYAATNPNEYFAEATQAYFIGNDLAGKQDRDWLKKYDPQIFELLDRVYKGR